MNIEQCSPPSDDMFQAAPQMRQLPSGTPSR
jgi:hypothetical protein